MNIPAETVKNCLSGSSLSLGQCLCFWSSTEGLIQCSARNIEISW